MAENSEALADCAEKIKEVQLLFVGDGPMSGAVSYIRKHHLSAPKRTIIATELRGRDVVVKLYGDYARRNLEFLRAKKVKVLFNVNARNLHVHFTDKVFQTIYWICPDDGTKFECGEMGKTIRGFFASASRVQALGGKIRLVFPDYADMYMMFDLIELSPASTQAGYRFDKRRPSFNKRYEPYGYTHRQTTRDQPATKWVIDDMKELVFSKWSDSPLEAEHYRKVVIRAIGGGSFRSLYPRACIPGPDLMPDSLSDSTDSKEEKATAKAEPGVTPVPLRRNRSNKAAPINVPQLAGSSTSPRRQYHGACS